MNKGFFSKKLRAIVATATVATLVVTSVAPTIAKGASESDTAVTSQTTEKNYKNVMYYGDWSVWGGQKNFYPQDIPAENLTHLNFAFMDFDANGDLKWTDQQASVTHALGYSTDILFPGNPNAGILNGFKELKLKNPNLKIGVSLGGWSMCGDFTTVTKDATKRANLVQNLMDFIKYCDMDFVDIDWEYPAQQREGDKCDNYRDEGTPDGCPEDKEYFISLLEDLRAALDKQGEELGKKYELTAALPAPIAKLEAGIDVKRAFELLDFANMMTYDMRGAWDTISGHQTGLYTNPNDPMAGLGLSIDECVKYLESKGAPSEKIVIGAAYYTRGWEKVSNEGIDPNCPGLFGSAEVCAKDANGDPTPGAEPEIAIKDGEGGRRTGVWSYNALDDLKKKYSGLQEYWDDVAKAPYLYNPDNGAFFTYDNVRSIQEKCKYVKENNLGGMIAWMASMDKATTEGSTVRDELTKATKEGLYGSRDLVDYPQQVEKLDLSASVAVGTVNALNTGKGCLELTITNNEKMTQSSEVLKDVETSATTLMNGKIYIKTNGIELIGGQYPLTENSVVKIADGEYYIDLADTYSDKMIKAGETKTYRLDVKDALTSTDGVESVSVTRRIYPISEEYGRQCLYGYDGSIVEYDKNQNAIPCILGIKNQSIFLGEKFNPLAGVTAIDEEDGDITSKIQVSGTVNNRVKGEYPLTYEVTDSNGATRKVTVTIKVVDKTVVLPDNFSTTTDYKYGDIVVYGGMYYQYLFNGPTTILPGTHAGIWKEMGPAIEVVEPEFDVVDLAYVASCYRAKKGDALYSEDADINSDGVIDIVDIVLVAKSM